MSVLNSVMNNKFWHWSLPEQAWGHVKLVLMHNKQIKMFDSITSHLKLEADRRESEHAQQAALVTHVGDKAISVAKEYRVERRTWQRPNAITVERWATLLVIALSQRRYGATKYVTRDRARFVDYHQVPACCHYIAMGNNAQEEVLGIGSYHLKLSLGRELLLSDVQYTPSIRCIYFQLQH
ncbi:hypothetical protein Salat_2666000 [Sesamum alatum]|uniref:Retrovirus-related Pol polyprotein from transposon TNT 1-94-like beta-barrel domain-containing protein n=1 Tax=Sesamum alatum TaxID=300844 RepID=A0AAE1XPH8_9LAMI|nr:hypothetical protein Salat_2666000 [Sesamum alatum]